MGTTVDPERVKTLSDWVSRWPKAANLGFDEETREATIYAREKPHTAVVGAIPWKREGDVMTILSEPLRFSEQAVTAAKARYDEYHDEEEARRAAVENELRTAEADLLAAWRTYHAASPADRPSLRRDVLTAERTIRKKEAELSLRIKGDQIVSMRERRRYDQGTGYYVEPLPLDKRALPLTAIGP